MKKIILLAAIAIFLNSCSKDYLNKPPLDKITDVSLTYSPDEVKLYINQWYPSLPGASSYIYHDDLGTDNLLSIYYNNNPDLIKGLRTVPTSDGGWGITEWGKIRSVNFLLDNYKKSKDLAQIEKYIGEAMFFRALFYYVQFLTRFGGSPWVGTQLTTTSPELTSPRLKRNELADKILADLDTAISKLPSKTIQETGRVSKEVAQLLKARVALYEGSWEKYHKGTVFAGEGDPTHYFTIARDEAKTVMNSGLFALDYVGEPNAYQRLFLSYDYSSNKEIMLWRKFDRKLGVWTDYNRNPGRNGSGVGLTKGLIDTYLATDGKPIAVSNLYKGDDNLLTVTTNRDPRLSQTMFVPGIARTIVGGRDTTIVFTKPNINLSDAEKCSTGYELAKGADPAAEEQMTIEGSQKAIILFRYAEVLLIYAEAQAELGSITQSDLDISVNLLRQRVGMPSLTVAVGYVDPNGEFTAARGYTGVPVSNLLQEIRRERRVELACEGYRMDDIKRWAAAHLFNHDKIQGAKTAQFKNLQWVIDYFTVHGAPAAISGGYAQFMSETVSKWTPSLTEGVNYWTDSEGYLAPYQQNIPDGHFSFETNKSYLRPIPADQLVLNKNLVQNPNWPNK